MVVGVLTLSAFIVSLLAIFNITYVENLGPLSMFISSIFIGILTYIILGFGITIASSFNYFDFTEEDENIKYVVFERFECYFSNYIKTGLIKNLPYILALVTGVTLKVLILAVWDLIKSIKRIKISIK